MWMARKYSRLPKFVWGAIRPIYNCSLLGEELFVMLLASRMACVAGHELIKISTKTKIIQTIEGCVENCERKVVLVVDFVLHLACCMMESSKERADGLEVESLLLLFMLLISCLVMSLVVVNKADFADGEIEVLVVAIVVALNVVVDVLSKLK